MGLETRAELRGNQDGSETLGMQEETEWRGERASILVLVSLSDEGLSVEEESDVRELKEKGSVGEK